MKWTKRKVITKFCENCKREIKTKRPKQKFCSISCRASFYNKKRIPNLIGQKFGLLTVIEQIGPSSYGTLWLCRCECGKETKKTTAVLRDKIRKLRSCGCMQTEWLRLAHLKPKGESAFNTTFAIYNQRAKNANYKFTLSKKEFKKITQQSCYYCGSEPSSGKFREKYYNGAYIYNGIDRVDNTNGYTIDNVVPCCEQCNRMKHTYSQVEFLSQVEKIYKYTNSGKGI
jgi:hypothetical protein